MLSRKFYKNFNREGFTIWSTKNEEDFIKTTNSVVFAEINCSECNYNYQAVFRKTSPSKCPKCQGKLNSNTPQGRNNPISNYTEQFACNCINEVLQDTEFDDYEAKRKVICQDLGLGSRTEADIAIVKKGNSSRIYKLDDIKIVFEVKMSLVWNWEPPKNKPKLIADYDRHNGRGSIYRTDSILKAIGKGAIFRSHFKAHNIPYIVIGNCPPPRGYFSKIDGSVKSGIVQKFISLNPQPLIVDTSEENKRNPKETKNKGFLRIDSLEELKVFIKSYLENEQIFIGSMLEKQELGKLIKSLNLEKDYSEIGQEFFEKLYEVNS